MAIPASCPHCRAAYRVNDRQAGQRVRCRQCRRSFVVPDPAKRPDTEGNAPLIELTEADVVSAEDEGWVIGVGDAAPGPQAPRGVSRPVRRSERQARKKAPLSRLSPAIWCSLALGAVLAAAIGGGAAWWFWPREALPSVAAEDRHAREERPQPADRPPAALTLEELKAATVFIKIASNRILGRGRISGSGSGFLARVDGDTGYVVTNTHVIGPEGFSGPHRGRLGGGGMVLPADQITVIFRSGTPQEQSSPALVVAADADRDLAVLQVTRMANLPKPIDIDATPRLQETLPVTVYGFPFGEALALDRGNPAITVSRGSISSIRRTPRDEPVAIQIDGALNPGNSGGPVVDAEGRLVGVAVATIRGTGIGLAIPGREVVELFDGRLGGITSLQPAGSGSGPTREFLVMVAVQDPLRRIQSVVLRYLPAEQLKSPLPPNPDGSWPELPGASQVALQFVGPRAQGTFAVPADDRHKPFILQAASVDRAGRKRLTEPRTVTLPASAAPVVQKPPSPNVPAQSPGQPTRPNNRAPVASRPSPPVQPPPVVPPPPPKVPPAATRPTAPVPPVAFQPQPPKEVMEEIALPGAVQEVAVGGGGRYLILDLPELKQLAVFDAAQGRVVKYLPVAEPAVHVAAGANRLAVVYPNAKLIQLWNLTTFEKERTAPLPASLTGDDIHQVCMGSASSGPLFVYLPREKRTLALDLTRLTTTEVRWNHWSPSNAYGPLHMRASPDGTLLLGWAGGWAGLDMAVFDGGTQVGAYDKFEFSLGIFALPSADGRRVFTPWAIVERNLTAKKVPGLVGRAYLVPAREPGYFLALHAEGSHGLPNCPYGKKAPANLPGVSRLGFYTDDARLLVTVNDYAELKEPSALYWEQRVHYYPRAGLLVTLAKRPGGDRLVRRRVDLTALMERAGVDYLFVASQPPAATAGMTFTYPLDIRSRKGGVRVKLESGPPGLAVTPEGRVSWAVPAHWQEPEADVVLTLSDASGQEVLHRFQIVRAAP